MGWTPALRILSVAPTDDFKLVVGWTDGSTRLFDPMPLVRGSFMGRLCDSAYFKRVRVTPNAVSVEWPEGQDFAPETLYERSAVLGAPPCASRAASL